MIYSFLYLLIFSIGAVLIQKLYFTIPPNFSLLITASMATIYFNLINFRNLKKLYISCYQEKWLCFSIMITVLVMWNCSMTGVGLISAALYHFIYFTWLGVIGFVSFSFINWRKYYFQFYCGLGGFFLVSMVIWQYLHSSFSQSALIGVILALVGGTSAFIYFKQSQSLIKKIHLTATQILAVRFYLTIILMVAILPQHQFSHYFTITNILELIILAVFTLIAPLYFQQKALEKISSEQNAIILSLSPIAMAILEEIILGKSNFNYVIFYLLYTLIVASSYLFTHCFKERNL